MLICHLGRNRKSGDGLCHPTTFKYLLTQIPMKNNTPIKKKLGWIERTILEILKNKGVFNGKQSCLADELGAQKQDVNAAFKRLERAGYILMSKMPDTKCKEVTLRKENANG